MKVYACPVSGSTLSARSGLSAAVDAACTEGAIAAFVDFVTAFCSGDVPFVTTLAFTAKGFARSFTATEFPTSARMAGAWELRPIFILGLSAFSVLCCSVCDTRDIGRWDGGYGAACVKNREVVWLVGVRTMVPNTSIFIVVLLMCIVTRSV